MSGRTAPSDGEREQLRARLIARIPSWYRPWAHQLVPSAIGLTLVVGALCLLRDFQAWQLVMVPAAFVLLNAGEWRIHRDLLHRRKPPFQILYDRHTPEHHMVYLTDDMAMRSKQEFRLVLIPAFGILASFAGALVPAAILALVGQRNLGILFGATSMLYAIAYEQLHLAFHLPPDSFIGRRKIIAVLRRHHAVHHHPERMQRWNFNVTIPLWDLVRGTIYRSEGSPSTVSEAPAPGAADAARR
jgi:sterol desaturase/sphingolipid hydroxylase (fatty acid hydroxylase superfamily)